MHRIRIMQLGWVYHDDFLLHFGGSDHPERLKVIVEGLADAGLLDQMERLAFSDPNPRELWGVHVPAYVSLVQLACMRGMPFLGCPETQLCKQTYDTAMLAVGGVLAACDASIAGRVPRSFCAVRPPGHHAQPESAGGFCLFNNVAMEPGSGDEAYRKAFAEKIMPALYQYKPEFVLLSAGFDALSGDRIAHMNLEPESYRWMSEEVVKLADECCRGRLVSVLEGGYELSLLKEAVVQHVLTMMRGWTMVQPKTEAAQLLKAS